MSKFKEKFLEMRKNTPRHAQWLLLGAAFVVVLILLTILLGNKDDNSQNIAQINAAPAELKISPDMINWADVIVGDKKEEKIKINATAPVTIKDIQRYDDINGYSLLQACVGQIVDTTTACEITVTYAPSTKMSTKQTSIVVVWHKKDEPEDMARTDKIVLTLGATAPIIEDKPVTMPTTITKTEPVVVPDTTIDAEDDFFEEEDFISDEPETIQEEIVREIETIAPPVQISKKTESKKNDIVIPDGCSDFAFPAYNNSGRQIGWVKPSGGAYYYHTFADKDCSEPSGTYNPDNGIITDNSGKKIGTDADHIRSTIVTSGVLPELSNTPAIKPVYRARQSETASDSSGMGGAFGSSGSVVKPAKQSDVLFQTTDPNVVTSSAPYDRTFVLRQYKPIPATIVSDVRADIKTLELGIPVRATVDRNVYSDNGRTVIIPTGTLLLGYVTGDIPGPYKTIGRMNIKWYQFIRPDGVEFNFPGGKTDPYSADAQGRVGVPGRGSSDYLEQFFMPMITAFVPAAINLINPVADAFVNQIDLDNNTVVQSGKVRSSELAKNEIITAWNQVAQKLMVDMMDNTVPPFTIAAGTRITVYSPVDLQVTCGSGSSKKCAVAAYSTSKRRTISPDEMDLTPADDGSWVGQSRAFQATEHCEKKDGLWRVKKECSGSESGNLNPCGGYSYSTLKLWCDSLNYESKKALQYETYQDDQKQQYQKKIDDLGGVGTQQFNEEILGVKYNNDGTVQNPYATSTEIIEETPTDSILCLDGTAPDTNGCCTGEIYTDMGDQGFNCCPETGGDCFPPMF